MNATMMEMARAMQTGFPQSLPSPSRYDNVTVTTNSIATIDQSSRPSTVRSPIEGTGIGAGRPTHTHHDRFLLANSSEWNCSSGGHERTAQKLFQSPLHHNARIATTDCPLDLPSNSVAPSDCKLKSGHIRAMK